jgi:hypothetical protein
MDKNFFSSSFRNIFKKKCASLIVSVEGIEIGTYGIKMKCELFLG